MQLAGEVVHGDVATLGGRVQGAVKTPNLDGAVDGTRDDACPRGNFYLQNGVFSARRPVRLDDDLRWPRHDAKVLRPSSHVHSDGIVLPSRDEQTTDGDADAHRSALLEGEGGVDAALRAPLSAERAGQRDREEHRGA